MSGTAVFGVDLFALVQREAPNGEPQPGTVPSFFERCLSEVEGRGLEEVGICKRTSFHRVNHIRTN